jgi:hypothetical protein
VVAATTRVLAGRGRDLDQISVAINQETGPAEMRIQPEGAIEPLGVHAFGFRRLISKELQGIFLYEGCFVFFAARLPGGKR